MSHRALGPQFKIQKIRNPKTGEVLNIPGEYTSCCGTISNPSPGNWYAQDHRGNFIADGFTKAEVAGYLREHHEAAIADGTHDDHVRAGEENRAELATFWKDDWA